MNFHNSKTKHHLDHCTLGLVFHKCPLADITLIQLTVFATRGVEFVSNFFERGAGQAPVGRAGAQNGAQSGANSKHYGA